MFGISTAWKSSEINTGIELLKELEKTEAPAIELEYRLSSNVFKEISAELKGSSLQVFSLHNYCPHPEILPLNKASGDVFWLSAIDEQERKLAVQYSLRTIQNAHEIGAQAVVLHLGKIKMDREGKRWFELFEDGKFQDKEGQDFLLRKLKEREVAKKPYFDALLKSLDTLNKEAEKLNIRIGAENRYYWDDFPNFDEIGLILDHFSGGKIGYWHDVGHAQTRETFGLAKHEDFLKFYSDQLIGIHLHDCHQIGYNDHFAPGTGFVDYDMIKKYLPANALRIIEVHSRVTLAELQQGILFLKQKNIIE